MLAAMTEERTITTAAGPRPVPTSVLVVVAHPDDVDYGAAGTVAALTEAGVPVAYCLVTSGDAGDDTMAYRAEELVALREKEQTAAAAEVGVTDITFLHHHDGRVVASLELRRDIAAVIRRVRPDVVLSQSPVRNYERIFASHPDHLAAGEAALCAVYPDARNPRAFPELLAQGLEPHTVREVWLMGTADADLYVDVTATFERKIAALRAHASQTAHREDLDEMVRGWLTMIAERGGMPAGTLAEGFRVVATG